MCPPREVSDVSGVHSAPTHTTRKRTDTNMNETHERREDAQLACVRAPRVEVTTERTKHEAQDGLASQRSGAREVGAAARASGQRRAARVVVSGTRRKAARVSVLPRERRGCVSGKIPR